MERVQLAVLAFMIVALVMVAAGVFQVLEQSYYTEQGLDRLQFHQAVYFVFVTLATVGTCLVGRPTHLSGSRSTHVTNAL